MRIEVKAKNGDFHFDCDEGEQVLYAGLRQGVALPYECATGTCGTCKARTSEPTPIENVDQGWPDAPGRSYLKPQRGEFLMCQACVLDSCRIVVPSKLNGVAPEIRPQYCDGVIESIRSLNDDVRDFRVTLERPMSFQAGQFACIQTPSVLGYRAYSMVNFDSDEVRELHFVVKRKPGGAFSSELFDGSIDGAKARVFGPLGKAVFNPDEGRNLLCLAGGSGIAGMMAILRHADLLNYFQTRSVHVFFGVRSARDVFYLDELVDLVERNPDGLSVWIALSDEDASDDLRNSRPQLRFDTGFVHEVMAREMKDRYENVAAFVAGPPPMVDSALRVLIIDGRLPASDIRYDKFS
jgi:toluene monooxygenase electron transfer component